MTSTLAAPRAPLDGETVIAVSKKKVGLLLLGAIVFVAGGFWMFTLDEAEILSRRRPGNPAAIHGVGLAAMVFFGICGLYALRKLFDTKPALVFNSSGIIDNASAVSAGLIPWPEIAGAETFESHGQKLLVIHVDDPEKYIERGGALRRTLNEANHRMAGSPISIAANTLNIEFRELAALFARYYSQYGDGTANLELYVESGAAEEPEAQFLNWAPGAVKGTVGAGGLAILVLCLSSLDLLFGIKLPFWPAFAAALVPMFIFFIATPDWLPSKVVRVAHWVAVVWYLVLAVPAITLGALRGLQTPDLLLTAFVILGVWPCVLAIRKLTRLARVAQ